MVASHIFSIQLELVTYESLKEVIVEEMSKELQGLLKKYEGMFLEPKGLPPTRPQDHHIPLLPGSVSPSIRPYWYPYVQKREIEKVVNELLTVGSIQKSVSPSYSPVLLVRKKNKKIHELVNVCGLSGTEQHHNQGQVSHSSDRRAIG